MRPRGCPDAGCTLRNLPPQEETCRSRAQRAASGPAQSTCALCRRFNPALRQPSGCYTGAPAAVRHEERQRR